MKKIIITNEERLIFDTAAQQKGVILSLLATIGKGEKTAWENIRNKYEGNFDNAYIEGGTLILPWEKTDEI